MPDAVLSREVLAPGDPLETAATRHPFLDGVRDGPLPVEARTTLEAFADLVAGVLAELRLHAAYAERWGTVAAADPLPATCACTDFPLATASLGEVGETCAAMAPCMRLYAHLGQSLDAEAAGPYGAWVRTYADPGFEALAATLEALLDRHAQDGPEVRRAHRQAMELELGLFDGALA